MRLGYKWLLLLAITLLPFGLLMLAGFVWLWQQDLLLSWLGIVSMITLASWWVAQKLRQDTIEPIKLDIDPSENWTAEGTMAWRKVITIAERIQREDPQLDRWEFYWHTLREVMQTVALHFHPEQKNAILELRVPYLLKVIELLARDLRKAFSEQVPGSHIVTINDVIRGHRIAAKSRELYQLYRIVSVGIDPVSAMIRELKGWATSGILTASTQEIKRWLLDAYVKKIGYYAIELYSGHLVLDDEKLSQHITAASERDVRITDKRDEHLHQEPLRVLVLGQVKAGKSSLINALFGEMKALTDVLPKTSRVQPYLLERDGIERAIVLDSAGYEDSANPLQPLRDAEREVLNTDLILLVCSAKSAARHADKRLLQELQTVFRAKTQEQPPPIILVLNHIDQLRPFREWQPPYNVLEPTTPKARTIRDAMQAVADDLNLDLSQVVPVNLKPGQEYNIEEGVIPAILQTLDAANRLKYLRCLADYRDEEYWRQLWLQSKNAGKFIARRGFSWLSETGKRIDELIQGRS